MAENELPRANYHDKFRTTGELRGAAYRLSEALEGTDLKPLARELHDSICRFLPGPGDVTAKKVRFLLGEK